MRPPGSELPTGREATPGALSLWAGPGGAGTRARQRTRLRDLRQGSRPRKSQGWGTAGPTPGSGHGRDAPHWLPPQPPHRCGVSRVHVLIFVFQQKNLLR